MKPLAITAGEPAGIGPELCLRLAPLPSGPLVIVADRALLQARAHTIGKVCEWPVYDPSQPAPISILDTPLGTAARCGVLDRANAEYVLETLRIATLGCVRGEFAALVTGPVHKGIINDAGIKFSGHTEYLAEITGSELPVMMLTTPGLRVALVTTHLPLSEVSKAITEPRLSKVIEVLSRDLQRRYRIARPRIAVCGLNPHAGEGGHLGDEELKVIIPVLEKLRSEHLTLIGPLPADTAFTPERLQQCDVVLAMYHDQGLPVLKHKGFHNAVNVTLGLPIIRTSVDHGTALDIAGRDIANQESLLSAIAEAQLLVDIGMAGESAH